MAKLPKITVNKDYYFKTRFRIAKDLVPYFGKEFINKSLGTRDYNEAIRRLNIIYDGYKKIKDVYHMLTPDQIQTIVAKYVHNELEQDIQARADGSNYCGISGGFTNASGKVVTDNEMCDLTLADYLEQYKEDYDFSKTDSVQDEGITELKAAGIDYDANDETHRRFMLEFLIGKMKLYKQLQERCRGKIDFTPTAPIANTSTPVIAEDKGLSLDDAFVEFEKYYASLGNTSNQYNAVMSMITKSLIPFIKHIIGDDASIKDVTYSDLKEFDYFMCNKPNQTKKIYKNLTVAEILDISSDIPEDDIIKPKTRRDNIASVKQMFKYLEAVGLIDRDVSKALVLGPKNAGKKVRRIFDVDDRHKLFNWFDTMDDRKYVYYTLAYTGMRLSEFWKAEMKHDDEHNIWYFDLTNAQTKTEKSKRKIPLNDKLVELGIPQKYEELKRFNSHTISQGFNRNFDEIIEDSDNKVLYSFRHTVATFLLNNDSEHLLVSRLLGHSYDADNMTTKTYHHGFELQQLKEVVDKLY